MSEAISVRHDEVSWTPTDDGQVVILDLRTSRYLSLNSSAAVLWTRLADGAGRAGLVTELVDRYGLDEPTALRDVDTFLRDLRTRELIDGA